MAKRYLETGYYKSPFVRGLKGPLKAFYNFIICDCDVAGIWVKDLMIASTYIGFEITEKDFEVFIKAGKARDLKNGKYFFPDFIEHQYPKGLSNSNPANKKALDELKKYKLIDENMKVPLSPSGVPPGGTMVEVMVNVMVEEEVKVEVNVAFEDFWNLYDKKVGDQKKLKKKWKALTDMEREVIMDHIPKYKQAQPEKKYRKNPDTYLNNKAWLDEVIFKIPPKNQQPSSIEKKFNALNHVLNQYPDEPTNNSTGTD
jgi:hypothetical protein